MADEQVILVNDADQVVGTMEKLAAHQQGLLHRAISVFVVREVEGAYEVLLQQRQEHKYHSGGLWTNTCCSHPRPDEETLAAAERRLEEEMGLRLSLSRIGQFTYRAELLGNLVEHELDHVFVGQYSSQAIVPNQSEVADYRWMAIDELEQALQASPEQYTAWLQPALALLIQWIGDQACSNLISKQ